MNLFISKQNTKKTSKEDLMKSILLISIMILALTAGLSCTHMDGGMMGRGMMGSDSQRGDMGSGMMGRGYERQYRQPQKPLDEKDARILLENYLQSMRNPNLKLGEIKDLGHGFEVEILTTDNSLVDKIMVDKKTGWMRSVY
jgi:hypothetical protein